MTYPMRALAALSLFLSLAVSPGLSAQESAKSPSADPADRVFDVVELQKRPKPIKQGSPVYPYAMARAGLIGSVTVKFIIDQEGNVRDAFAIESNNPWFERPAVAAVERWKFTPGEIDGRPVNIQVHQRIDFNLSGNERGGDLGELWRVTKGKNHNKLPPEFQWETPPLPTRTMFPIYPFELLQAGVAGKAQISYVVGPDGRVVGAKLREATTPEFGRAVLAMVDAWRFQPAKKKDGTPCAATLGSEYEFRPNGRADVPVSDEAQSILRALEKKPETIATLTELDQPLRPRHRRSPAYPTALQKAGQPGQAVVEFFVDRNGDAQLPRIISSTAPEFGYAAVQAVATWRFEPPKRGGKTIVTRVQIPVNFSLNEKQPDPTP